MVKQHEKLIDGVTYKTTTLPASEAVDLMPRLIGMLGEKAMSLMMVASEEEATAILGDREAMAAILMHSSDRMASVPGGLSGVLKALLKYTTADKVKIGAAEVPGNVADNFDTHFLCRYGHLFNVCAWVMRAVFVEP